MVGWIKYVPESVGEGCLHQFSMEAKVKPMEYLLESVSKSKFRLGLKDI